MRVQEVYQQFGLFFGYEPGPVVGAKGSGVERMGGAIEIAHYEIRALEEAVQNQFIQALLFYGVGSVKRGHIDLGVRGGRGAGAVL